MARKLDVVRAAKSAVSNALTWAVPRAAIVFVPNPAYCATPIAMIWLVPNAFTWLASKARIFKAVSADTASVCRAPICAVSSALTFLELNPADWLIVNWPI